MSERQLRDVPEIAVAPPLLAGLVLAVGLLLDRLVPVYVLAVLFTRPLRLAIGLAAIAAGAGLLVAAEGQFRRLGTPAPPWKPTRALATRGIYGWIRNPIYVGAILMMAGLALCLAGDWLLLLLIPMAFVLHYGVVLREERYLEAKFGDEYRRYRERVPRYGWPG
jgi:protein-S-isoprenylcysteine O-methyltransferase Ste14